MSEIVTALLAALKEPILVFLFVIMTGPTCLLFWLLMKREKTILELNKTVAGLHSLINTNMAEGNETVAKLVTLVEFVVYGRGRNGNP